MQRLIIVMTFYDITSRYNDKWSLTAKLLVQLAVITSNGLITTIRSVEYCFIIGIATGGL